MNEAHTHKGPNPRLLLLVPVVLIIAKAGRHRRAMMEPGWSGTGHHGEMGARTFRLPPRIESALDAWHTRSHEASDAAGLESEPGTASA